MLFFFVSIWLAHNRAVANLIKLQVHFNVHFMLEKLSYGRAFLSVFVKPTCEC